MNTHDRAKLAAAARWKKHEEQTTALQSVDWNEITLEAGKAHLADMLAEYQRGSRIIQQRIGAEQTNLVCFKCNKKIPNRPVAIFTVKNHKTQLQENIYLCSPTCHSRYYTEDKASKFGAPR